MSKKITIIITIIVAVIAIGVTATYITLRQGGKEVKEQPVATVPEVPEKPPVQPSETPSIPEPVTQPEEPTATKPIDTSDWKTYRNKEYGFEVRYPGNFIMFEGEKAPYPSGALFPPAFFIGPPTVRFSFPESYYAGTNLLNGSFSVHVYDKAEDNEKCPKGVYTKQFLSETRKINGITFHKDQWGEGGAGHRYNVVSYRRLYQGKCYDLNLVTYWSQIALENGNIKPFDTSEVSQILDQILSTFRFIEPIDED